MRLALLTCLAVLASTSFYSKAYAQVFDISGIQVGMSPSEVEAAVTGNGYVPKNQPARSTHIYPGKSYQQLIQERQGKRISMSAAAHEGVAKMSFQKEKREFLNIKFKAFISGPKVISVEYKLKDSAIDGVDFIDYAVAKFGEPEKRPLTKREEKLLSVHRRTFVEQKGETDEERISKYLQFVSGIYTWKSDQNYSIESIPANETVTLGIHKDINLRANINELAYKKALTTAAAAARPKTKLKTSF